MPFSRLIDQFEEKASSCSSDAQLRVVLEDAAGELGFSYFALLLHGSLHRRIPGLLRIDNYPEGWEAELVARTGLASDPVHLASARTNIGFAWSELGALVP